ncbi:uncharacterized protein LOC122074816 isoform X2 [Macadamia integrifolia]|uniref:uncharacterized protein LOC122074816 isoform X2 n=1 Tax=Macadamia integrifolia TaxID=60698 RepID=UPI001C4EBD36|nr:uncharacterized protein LOC122074816 isoform X2 [Macadamia integrifolia]
MTSQEGSQTISLKLLIDKKNNRVVMAETEGDFVDILFSFFTMPMGTMVRLISKNSKPATIGIITSLYKEVEKLEEQQLLQTQACKSMLLHPRNPYENMCRKLKLNIDDTEPTKYYICADWNCSRRESGGLYTTFKNVRCNCGKMMDKEILMAKEVVAARPDQGDGGRVFLGETNQFMVTDDLQVEAMSPTTIVTLLHKLGVKDMGSLQETTLSIGSEEILNLLEGSLFSKTPLTDVFLRKREFTSEGLKYEMGDELQSSWDYGSSMTLKLMMSKSMNKVLYAEAKEDMVNFLLSILTFPLGSILQLLGGKSSLGSMDNLYNSVHRSCDYGGGLSCLLQRPNLCRGFGCSSNPLNVNETETAQPPYSLWCRSYASGQNKTDPYTGYLTTKRPNINAITDCLSQLRLVNPKSPTSETVEHRGGFVKRPAKFMALRILKASLFSNTVLTDALVNFGLKIPKQEN